MLKVGFVGWRGLVGSVLLQRMRECGDFEGLASGFFSTSGPGTPAPMVPGTRTASILGDAFDVAALGAYDVVVSCQGGDYTRDVHPRLRAAGWDGYWIDAASALRMEPSTVLVLDPVNLEVIERGLAAGRKDYCGANCTVSLMLMALAGLFKAGAIEWMTSMTYQAASGAGAQHMVELASQMRHVADAVGTRLDDPAATALEIDHAVSGALGDPAFPTARFGVPLAGSLIPWIDKPMGNGRTREEWKAHAEGNKILGIEDAAVPIDGICVRIAAMRCHGQGFTVKLRRALPLDEIESLISAAHPWVRVIPNTPEASIANLTPARVTGRLEVPVGRLRKLAMGEAYLTGFSVGDQLLWGAAEPLRRMLRILRTHLGLALPEERAVA